MKIYKYDTEEESQVIKEREKANGMVLVAISNIVEGNFLGFMSTKLETEVIDNTPKKITDMQNTIDLLLLKQEGIL